MKWDEVEVFQLEQCRSVVCVVAPPFTFLCLLF